MRTSAIIVAAGKGRRMGKDFNKQYIMLSSKPIIAHTIENFERNNLINEIILVVGKGEVDFVNQNIIKRYNFSKISRVVEGGAERQDSVYNGLKVVDPNCDVVLVHDGARPFITHDIIEETIRLAKESGACIAAVPVKDTIKVVSKNMDVVNTPNRETLWAVQTPQTFQYKILAEAYEKLNSGQIKATDDSMLIEELGYTVKVVEGSYENIKITTPEDLILGEGILTNRKEAK